MPTRRDVLSLALALPLMAAPLLRPVPARAAGDEAQAFVARLGAEAVQAIDSKQGTGALESRFSTLLSRDFDVPFIARFVLGPYWNQADPRQQQDYLHLFQELVVKTYARRFAEYAGAQLKVGGSQTIGDGDALVTSAILRPGAPPVRVDWRVRDIGGAPKIIDVAVENVSMSVTQRSEFSSVIQNGGGRVQALIDSMRKQVAG